MVAIGVGAAAETELVHMAHPEELCAAAVLRALAE